MKSVTGRKVKCTADVPRRAVVNAVPIPTIVSYRRALCRRLDDKWEWECPVWFTNGIFADAYIKGVKPFKTQREAVDDMNLTIPKFGITRHTQCL